MSVVQKQDGMFAAVHSVRGEAAVPGAAEYEHRSPPVHCINRADTRLVAAPLLSQMLSLDVFTMYFTVVHSVQIPRTTGQYMKLCNLKVLHEALPLMLLSIVVQVPALFRRILVLTQFVRVLVANLEDDCVLSHRAWAAADERRGVVVIVVEALVGLCPPLDRLEVVVLGVFLVLRELVEHRESPVVWRRPPEVRDRNEVDEVQQREPAVEQPPLELPRARAVV